MKKRILSLSIVFCLLLSTIAYAAGATKIEALVSGMKIYFNGKALKGDVLTAKGVTYLPMDILSNNLGFKLSADTKNKKFAISEIVNKSDLQKNVTNLQSQNNELKSKNSVITTERDLLKQENANLNAKLAIYLGTMPDDTSYKKLTGIEFTYGNDISAVYNSYWNKVTPFKVSNKAYEGSIWGIQFNDIGIPRGFIDGYGSVPGYYYKVLPNCIIDNSSLNYSKLKFNCAIDDMGIGYNYSSNPKIAIYGISNALGDKELLAQSITRDGNLNQIEVDVKGYEKIQVIIYPSKNGSSPVSNEGFKKYSYATMWNDQKEGTATYAYKDYIVIGNMQVK